MIWILRLLVAFFLTGVTTHAVSAITVTGLELVSSKRVGRTVFEYTYKNQRKNQRNGLGSHCFMRWKFKLL